MAVDDLHLACDIATDMKLRTIINSQYTHFEGVYRRLVLTALATAIIALHDYKSAIFVPITRAIGRWVEKSPPCLPCPLCFLPIKRGVVLLYHILGHNLPQVI